MFSHEFCIGNEAVNIRTIEVKKVVENPDVVVYLYYGSIFHLDIIYDKRENLNKWVNGINKRNYWRHEYLNIPNF
jgi:hypothetical protein